MSIYFGNRIEIDGELVKTGSTPGVLKECGFRDADEVRDIAAKCSLNGEPKMRMDDVAEWFKNNV